MSSEPPTPQTPLVPDDAMGPDHDLPYQFGRRPRASAPYPFSTHQYARLLVLRSRVRAALPVRHDQPRTWHPDFPASTGPHAEE